MTTEQETTSDAVDDAKTTTAVDLEVRSHAWRQSESAVRLTDGGVVTWL